MPELGTSYHFELWFLQSSVKMAHYHFKLTLPNSSKILQILLVFWVCNFDIISSYPSSSFAIYLDINLWNLFNISPLFVIITAAAMKVYIFLSKLFIVLAPTF